MKPVYQTRLFTNGNCFEDSIASLLELDIDDVPDLLAYQDDQRWVGKLNEWLAQKGLCYMESLLPLEDVEDFFSNKDFYHTIISDTTSDGKVKHAVIARKGKMIHDPHPAQLKMIEPDEFLRIGYLVSTCN